MFGINSNSMTGFLTKRYGKGFLLSESNSASAAPCVDGGRTAMRQISRTQSTKRGAYWTYKAVNKHPRKQKKVNGPKLLEEIKGIERQG